MSAAVVTGSDLGIGEAAALALAQAGFDVGVTFHSDADGAEQTAERVRQAGRRAEVRRLDQADPEQARAVVHEHVPLPGSSAYCASKGGLGLLVKTMALELAEHGIRVNAVAPGEIATAMTGNEDVDPRGLQRPMIPLGRPGDANEVGALIAFLCGGGAGYATGASFVVDGGMLLMPAAANAPANR